MSAISLAPDASAASAPKPAQIYITAAHADRSVSSRLAQKFEALGYRAVWERDIGAINSEAEAAARGAPCVIALWSRASCTSKWVIEDAELAAQRGALIEVLIDPVHSPLDLAGIREPIDLSQDDMDSEGWGTLVAMGQLMAGSPARPGASKLPNVVAQSVAGAALAMLAVWMTPSMGPNAVSGDALEAPDAASRFAVGGIEAEALGEPASAPRSEEASLQAPIRPLADELPVIYQLPEEGYSLPEPDPQPFLVPYAGSDPIAGEG